MTKEERRLANRIISTISFYSPHIHFDSPGCREGCRENILALIKEAHYVRLAEDQARLERIKSEIDSKMQLERCDPDTMAYFSDYYWIDKIEWQEFWKREGIK